MSGPPRRGRFIVLEGGEGAGKSTLLASLASRFAEAGVHAVTAREPGGTAAGERIRDLLHEALTPWAEAFAFLAARAELVERVIRPALEDGAVVICDRFGASTLAYQGYGRGLDLATLRAAHAAATGGLEPDLTIYLDVDPEGRARSEGRRSGRAPGGPRGARLSPTRARGLPGARPGGPRGRLDHHRRLTVHGDGGGSGVGGREDAPLGAPIQSAHKSVLCYAPTPTRT